ncbi:cupin domain-containing protein [Halopenitus persicus]|uniref:Cupin domain protein n=1 Tax=Halopenitus persicus TaxID=1048396 RepID=A0A1H3E683_9EURY|nr:cupin domain-containing protein [Halopenitus persicus]SDX74252.1 Cupin domain protein [Halopenitus persicus]
MTREFTMVEFDDTPTEPSRISGVPGIDLTERLGCEEVRARVWYLDPGDAMAPHKQDRQEELYIPLAGPCQIRIDGELVTVPTDSAVRIPPDTPRQLRNDDQHQHVWLVVGAPPVEDDGIPLTSE